MCAIAGLAEHVNTRVISTQKHVPWRRSFKTTTLPPPPTPPTRCYNTSRADNILKYFKMFKNLFLVVFDGLLLFKCIMDELYSESVHKVTEKH